MKIVFVCTANVCRSPLSEGYFKMLMQSHPRVAEIDVCSAGIMALKGSPAFECSIEVGRQYGFDLTNHRAQRLELELASQADRLLFMETWQVARFINSFPEFSDKAMLLGAFHPSGTRLLQIPDPRTFTTPETLKTFQLIKASIEAIITDL
jgi:protein-tyrosine phosphatase